MNWLLKFFTGTFRYVSGLYFNFYRFLRQVGNAISSAVVSLARIKEERVTTGDAAARNPLKASNYLNPVFWILQGFGWLFRYGSSRPPIPGVQGLPALGCVLALIFCGTLLTPSLADRVTHARGSMLLCLKNSDFEKADFFSRQLCFMVPNDPAFLFARAELLDKMDRPDDKLATMTQLANERKYLPAMEWLCEKNLELLKSSPVPDEQRELQLILGLTSILEIQPANIKANSMLGTFYVAEGQFSRAVPLLEKAAELSRAPNPALHYVLAVAQKNVGQLEKSKSNATVATNAFVARNSIQPYSVQRSIELLRAMILAEQEQEAVLLIQQSLPKRTEQEAAELKWLLGEVYAQWCQRLRVKRHRTAENLAQALNAIYKGIAAAPNNPVVTEEMVQLSCVKDVDDRVLQEQLEVALNAGVSPGLVHFILGTRLVLAGNANAQEALQHFELAMQHNASLPGLLNNIADAMVETDSTDTARALTLVDQAISLLPNQPYFFDTRGKILLKTGEPQKAVADLEKALAAPELRVQVHAELAAAYLTLNDQKNYAYHTTMSENYRKQQATTQPTDKNQEPRTKNQEP